MSRLHWLAWGLAVVAALAGDGGTRVADPSSGVLTAAPPIPKDAPAEEIEAELVGGSLRRAYGALLERVARRPDDLDAAVGMVAAVQGTGLTEVGLRQLAALRRRRDSVALQIAEFELRHGRSPASPASSVPGGAPTGRKVSLYRALLRAVVGVSDGDLAAMWSTLALWDDDRERAALEGASTLAMSRVVSRRRLVRWQQLRAMASRQAPPHGALLRVRAVAQIGGTSGLSTRVELLSGALYRAVGRSAEAELHERSALQHSVRDGRNWLTYIALAQLRSGTRTRSHWGRNAFPVRLCALVVPERVRLRHDCLLTALEHAWKGGEFENARRLHGVLGASPSMRHPVLHSRFAALSVPLLASLGRSREAARLAAAGLPIAERLGDRGSAWQLRLHLARLARRSGDPAAGRRWLDGSAPGEVPRSLRVAVELERARVTAATGSRVDAANLLARAARMARDSDEGDRWLVRVSRLAMGSTGREEQGRPLAKVLGNTIDTPVDSLSMAIIQGRVAEEDGRLEEARDRYRLATRWVGEVIRATRDEEIRRALAGGWYELADRQALLSLRLGDPGAALKALESLQRHPGAPAAGLHVQDHLGSGDLVLVFRRLGDDLWSWAVRRDGVRAFNLGTAPERLEGLVSLWSALLRRGGEHGLWLEIGRRLTAMVMEPLRRAGALEDVSRITVVAREPLGRIPFDVLPVEEGGGRLYGETIVWSRASSLALLDSAWHEEPRRGPAVGFGPDGSSAVLGELGEVVEGRRGTLFVGPRATETSFVERAPRSALIHFGGHAVPPGALLDEGGLVLRPTLADDGFLSYGEITTLDLRGSSVVLLGCDTARAATGPPVEWLRPPATLAEAFLVAGSRNVVGSLWPLSEAAAGEIAEAFYSAGGPEAGAISLAIAKRVLRDRHPDAPERWAGAVWEGPPAAATR